MSPVYPSRHEYHIWQPHAEVLSEESRTELSYIKFYACQLVNCLTVRATETM